jgi:hypothetical protein
VRSGILETTYRVVLRGSGSGGGCRGDATTDDGRLTMMPWTVSDIIHNARQPALASMLGG